MKTTIPTAQPLITQLSIRIRRHMPKIIPAKINGIMPARLSIKNDTPGPTYEISFAKQNAQAQTTRTWPTVDGPLYNKTILIITCHLFCILGRHSWIPIASIIRLWMVPRNGVWGVKKGGKEGSHWVTCLPRLCAYCLFLRYQATL